MARWIDGDDPFDTIFDEFFGRSRPGIGRERFIRGEDEERVVDLIDDSKNAFLIFELPGYTQEDVEINIKGKNLEIIIQKKNLDEMKDYLAQKFSSGMKFTRVLPDSINPKKYQHSLKNGILEIKFEKR